MCEQITSLDPIKLKLIDFDCAVAIPEYPTSKADELTTAFQNIPRTVRWTPVLQPFAMSPSSMSFL